MVVVVTKESLYRVIRDQYVQFNTSVDKIAASSDLSSEFARLVNAELPAEDQVDVETIIWRLFTLRKRGEENGGLPRLQRAYHGRETKPSRRPKPR